MRDATIATSRTRATSDQLLDYRPLPAAWGDLAALRAVRAEKARAAARGLDSSTLEIAAGPASAASSEPAPRPVRRDRPGPITSRRRGAGAHRRRLGRGRLATA